MEEHAQTLSDAGRLAALLEQFSGGLLLLDDYDHETLDEKGKTGRQAVTVSRDKYLTLIDSMKSDF